MPEKLRIDKYLWAIRIFKTRTQAAAACDQGKVKSQGETVKPSRAVLVGDQYEIRTKARKWVVRVTGILASRMQHSEAIKYYTDITPEEDLQYNRQQAASFYTGKRLSKVGRPTKKQRRNLDGFMDNE
ncbi:MAG TPA: RNA-binding S4 domain-containing protein [Chitinophagaceae bacterium]|nr:RNA-binding S4 domain-containing protein [Chitinophagaceae bacterium]